MNCKHIKTSISEIKYYDDIIGQDMLNRVHRTPLCVLALWFSTVNNTLLCKMVHIVLRPPSGQEAEPEVAYIL